MEGSHGSMRDLLNLRFRDPRLEREFQAEMAATNGSQARDGAAVAIGPAHSRVDHPRRHQSIAVSSP
jgi:hypothetical protein